MFFIRHSSVLMVDLTFNSPEEEIFHPLFAKKKISVYLKRDDQIHPFISGNKWRKLKYPLINARANDKTHLVTFGGVWSNHLLATACAAAKFGFKSTAFVRGEDINTDTLFLCRMFGMNLQFTDRESYRDKQALFNRHFSEDATATFIDEGGSGVDGARGVAEMVTELKQSYNHVFCACGTGTTAAGIINGLASQSSQALFHAVSVLKGSFLKKNIQKLLLHHADFELNTDYHFGGYAKTSPELLQFISDFASSSGILLDQVYTGKMMYALFDLAKKDTFKPGEKILAIHTGGLFGLLGIKEQFAKFKPLSQLK